MANVIKLHKGLNINLKGKPAQEFFDVKQPDIYAIVPDDYHGVTPKVVVKCRNEDAFRLGIRISQHDVGALDNE